MSGEIVNVVLLPETIVVVPGVTVPPVPLATQEVIVNTWSIERVTAAVCVVPLPLPVIVMGYVPARDPAPTVIVSVELLGGAMGFGLKVAVVP